MPPHLRKNPQQGRATRTAPQGIPGSGRSSVSSASSPQPSPTQHTAPVELDSNLNGGICSHLQLRSFHITKENALGKFLPKRENVA